MPTAAPTTDPLERFKALATRDPAEAQKLLGALRKKVFVPHDGGQREVMESKARFRILRAGRRWGKTQLAAHEVIMAAISQPGAMVWWVANSDKNVRRGYRAVLKQLPRPLLAAIPPSEGANDRILRFKNGSQIEFYTAGTPDSLAGEGVDFLVVDEAALIPENVWFQLLRPTLSDTGGRALVISTPRGRNWFWKLWMRGVQGGLYESFHHPSVDNPYIDAEEVQDAQETLPKIIFEQEYLGKFLANAASMFTLEGEREVDGETYHWSAVVPGLVQPHGWVVVGIDLAKKEDFTVISACNAEDRRPCYHERFNEISWPEQERIIADVIRELEHAPGVEGITVVIDSTGIGDVVFDHLDEMGMDVIPVNFTNMKERMVRLLAADLEHGHAFITEEERAEHESYEYEITNNGRYKFEAATGHDDRVSAKILQNWGVVHESPPDVKLIEDHDPVELEQMDGVWWDTTDEGDELVPDSPQDIMNRPEAWSSSRVAP